MMGLLSLNQIAPNLANTTQSAAGAGASVNLNLGPAAPSAPLVDLGISLGSGSSGLNLGVQVLEQSAGGSLIGLNLGTVESTATPGPDLNSTLASLSQALNAPPINTPEISGLSNFVNNVLAPVGVDASVDLDVGSGTAGAPLIDLGVSLGNGNSAHDLGAHVPGLGAGGSLAGVDLSAGSDTGTSAPGLHLNANVDLSTGSTAPTSEGGSELPALPTLVHDVVEATGLDDLLAIDLGSGPAPSTSAPVAPGTGAGGGAEVAVGSGGVDVGANVGGTGGTTGTGGPTVPANSATTGNGGGISAGADVSTGSGGGTGSTGTAGIETPTSGGGHGGSVIHVGHGVSLGTLQATDFDQRHWMDGSSGNDTMVASNGNDTVYGHDGNDAIFANQGADRIFGGQGDDYLRGGRGDDMVSGGDGDDHIWGDLGDDVLEGGDGADVFYFALNSGHDVILDFNYTQGDRLDFQGQDYSVTEAGGTTVVHLSGGGHVALSGISAAEFNSYGFA